MKQLFCLLLALQFLTVSGAGAAEDDIIKNTQSDIFIVAGAGAAGAVLGLSTLSFVDEPSDHLRNIWTGAALGIIAGVVYVAYSSATRSSEDLQSSVDFSTKERVAWHRSNVSNSAPSRVQFGSTFWTTNF